MKLLKKASTIAPGPEPGLTMCLAATYSMHELLARTPRGRRPLGHLAQKANTVLTQLPLLPCFQILKTSAKGQNVSAKSDMLKV